MKKLGFKQLIAGISAVCVAASALPVMSFAAETNAATLLGDANCDAQVDMSDVVMVMQALANPNKYGIGGSDANAITEQGWQNADCNGANDGVSTNDALAIQMYLLGKGTLSDGKGGTDAPVTEATKIHLRNTYIEVEGENASVEGAVVTITHSGEFYIDGTLDDGQINVNIPDEKADPDTVKIFLNGVNITGKSAPAIRVTNAENTSINIVDGTENTITDGDTAYESKEAVIEAKDDITIKGGDNGDGVLNVVANIQGGISCNNDIKINGGHIKVTTLNSDDKTDAVKAKKSITVKSGVVDIDAEGDGIKSSKDAVAFSGGYTTIKAGNDAVQAETTIDISGGTLVAGGDRGLTAAAGVNITGGTVAATATDNQLANLTASQGAMLLNCIDDPTNEKDGTWKKSNSIIAASLNVEFTKKYKYVLLSDESIKPGRSYELTNVSSGNAVQYSGGVKFVQNELITIYNEVNPAGIAAPGDGDAVNPPAPAPADGEYNITLSSSGIATDASADIASVNGGVLTISQPGVFAVTGEMTGGQIVIDVDKNAYPDGSVELELSGMSLTNTVDSPIYVASIGDEAVITAKNGTENTISDGSDYTNADGGVGAVYSKDDIKFKGKGTLTVNGNAGDAIVGKDDVKIYNGTLVVNAANDGIQGKDSVTIGNTASDGKEADYSALSVTVNTKAGDGIKATSSDVSASKQLGAVVINGGTVNIQSYADGIQAEQLFTMNGGDVTIKTYEGSSYTGSGTAAGGNTGNTGWGGRPGMGGFGGMDGNSNKPDISAKGIKAVGIYDEAGTTWQSAGDIVINGGTLNIDSSDDSLHCGGNMDLKGGALTLASADDAAHADHTLTIGTMGGGYEDIVVIAEKCYEGMEAQKIYQNSGSVIINSTDDGYNAAGGSDGSGFGNTGGPGAGWGQGGFGGSGSGDYLLQFNGGFALVNATDGDHDGFDSNGNIEINGGYLVTNGNEPFDSDGSISVTGGVWVSNCGSGGMGGFGGGSSMTASVTASSNLSANTRLSLVGSDGTVIVSFIVDKSVSQLKAGGTGTNGASFQTGGTLNGSTYFQQLDQTQLAAFGGTLSGGTRI